MSESKETLTRYLLGELPEAEQAALEERYFSDPRVFVAVTDAESALVDDYARHRLAPEARRSFEQFYLAHPRRRERAGFAATLVARLDRPAAPGAVSARPQLAAASGWRAWLDPFGGPVPAFGVALATLVILSGVWFVADSRRAREEAALAGRERSEREALAAAERAGAGQPAGTPTPVNQSTGPENPNPPERPAPSFVTLALVIGPGVRAPSAGPPATLVIPPGTSEVRLALSLKERDYAVYRVILRQAGGGEILRRGDLQPGAGSGPAFTLTLPSSRFPTGDYILTLQGATPGSEFEDLSQSLFRVDKR